MNKESISAQSKAQFDTAEQCLANRDYMTALSLYHGLKEIEPFASISLFRIAWIANILNDPEYASECYYKAFKLCPDLNSKILPVSNKSHSYIYNEMDGRRVEHCPLCGGEGKPFWCYYIAMQHNCPKYFNPIRTWLYCGTCHHLWSAEPTDYRPEEASLLHTPEGLTANPARFPLFSRILTQLRSYAKGSSLLEVGVGKGECIAVAKEMLFNVSGIDLTKESVDYVNKTFKLDVIHGDFFAYSFGRQFDVIMMGDVIEHVRDPRAFIRRVDELSHPGTVFWISTPNFESSFTLAVGHDDPMRREPAHCGYFSYMSLNNLLDEFGFDVVNYEVSAQFNGSMELTAIKKG